MKQNFCLLFFIILKQFCIGQSLWYKDYWQLSQDVHPLLVHLKGNVKTIKDSKGRIFRFENKKLIADNKYCYHYDKDGYLFKATSYTTKYDYLSKEYYFDTLQQLEKIFFIKDSITKKLLKIRSDNKDVELVYNNDTIEYYFSNHKIAFYSETINNQGQVIASKSPFNASEFIVYDENGHIKYSKTYVIGGACTYISYIDKYLNEMYYGCENYEPIVIYNDLDKYGNWQFSTSEIEDMGLSMQQKPKKSIVNRFFTITRKYEYYDN